MTSHIGPDTKLSDESTSEFFLFCFFSLCGTWASHCCSLTRCGAQAPDARAQRPWLTGPAAPWHVGSSWTGVRTRVPCIGRRTLNHCATREALLQSFKWKKALRGNSLTVQWLGLCALIAKGLGSIPGQGTKISQAPAVRPKKKKE